MPRRYTLGKRAGTKDETRARIVAAALRIYGERGVAAASNLAIARAADVAPATVRNHFSDPQDLANAAFDEVVAQLQPPTPAIFEDGSGIGERVTRLASELAAFYERSEPAWQLYRQEPDLIQAWSGGVDRYYASIDELMRIALGPLSGDDLAMAVMAAVIGPPTFFALRARGLSSRQAVDLTLELALPWFEARARASAKAEEGAL